MPLTSNEPTRLYRKGLSLLSADRPEEAVEYFARATRLERERGDARPRMKFLSYYGLSLALAHGVSPEAIRCCENAARGDRADVALKINLARVYRMAGRDSKAMAVLARGLETQPDNREMATLLASWERRRPPLLPALGRDNVLNRWWGRYRNRPGRSPGA